jgi:hypothetical protein
MSTVGYINTAVARTGPTAQRLPSQLGALASSSSLVPRATVRLV